MKVLGRPKSHRGRSKSTRRSPLAIDVMRFENDMIPTESAHIDF
jgi:hypothetical protein